MQLPAEEIRKLSGHIVFERGLEYFTKNKVLSCELKNGVLFARVQGNRTAPYRVKIYFAGKNKFHTECTCPYEWGLMCKHTVAALLYSSQDRETTLPANPAALRRPSVLFSDQKNPSAPILRFILPNQNNFGISSKGYKVETCAIVGEKIIKISDPASLVNPKRYRGYQPTYPAFEDFSLPQQYCLRLLSVITKNTYYSDSGFSSFELALLFKEAAGHEGIQFYAGRIKPMQIRLDPKIAVTIDLGYTKTKSIEVHFFANNPTDPQYLMRGHLVPGRPCWMVDFEQGNIFPFEETFDENLLTKIFLINGSVVIPPSDFPAFTGSIIKNIKEHCTLIYRNQELTQLHTIEAPPVFKLLIDGSTKRIVVDFQCLYDQRTLSLKDIISIDDEYLPCPSDTSAWIRRDMSQEKKAVRFLYDDCGFDIDEENFLRLEDPEKIARFVLDKLPAMGDRYEIHYTAQTEKQLKARAALRPHIQLGSDGLDWFHFEVQYQADGIEEKFSQEEIRRQLQQGKKYVQLKDGSILSFADSDFAKVEDMIDEFDGKIKDLPAFHTPFLIEEARRNSLDITFNNSFRRLHEKLKQFQSIQPVSPAVSLENILRDYQRKGLDWLEFLRGFQFGGILADEMGLGKTLQVLALLKNVLDTGETLPHLVICPTTLVWNWHEEIKKFCPDLKVLIPQGPQRREQITKIGDYNLVITSYALLRRDAQFYEKLSFDYVILDEAQNIKNHNTLNARLSKKIKSRHRLVLTGTPLENSISDIWSIFDFLMPGFLGNYERFRNRYEQPILRDQSKPTLEKLARKIKPFLLRRLKTEVIKELPPKMQQVSFCELEPTQYQCYKQMLAIARKEVVDAFQTQGFNKSRMKILTVILRLRQICCHPELAHVKLGHRLSVSAKLNLLKELLAEALSGGHRVLIFSQFIGMLGIIAQYLKKEDIVFEYMDGSTTERRECVDRFNSDTKVKVFLLSLKVGGVGLNLTGADTVIIFEPWWNPAVEDQAIDRAHRIGQRNTVTAYKLICKGTIEEKMLELQKRKRNMIDSLVIAEDGIAKKLGWEDIKFLLDIS